MAHFAKLCVAFCRRWSQCPFVCLGILVWLNVASGRSSLTPYAQRFVWLIVYRECGILYFKVDVMGEMIWMVHLHWLFLIAFNFPNFLLSSVSKMSVQSALLQPHFKSNIMTPPLGFISCNKFWTFWVSSALLYGQLQSNSAYESKFPGLFGCLVRLTMKSNCGTTLT